MDEARWGGPSPFGWPRAGPAVATGGNRRASGRTPSPLAVVEASKRPPIRKLLLALGEVRSASPLHVLVLEPLAFLHSGQYVSRPFEPWPEPFERSGAQQNVNLGGGDRFEHLRDRRDEARGAAQPAACQGQRGDAR